MYALSGVLSAFQARLISRCESTDLLYHNACIVKVDSWIGHEIKVMQGKNENEKDTNQEQQKGVKKIEEQLYSFDQAFSFGQCKAYVCDVDAKYIIVQIEQVIKIVNKKMTQILKKLILERKHLNTDEVGSMISEIVFSDRLDSLAQDKKIKTFFIKERFNILTFHIKQEIKSKLRRILQDAEEGEQMEFVEYKYAQQIKDLKKELIKYQTSEDALFQQLKPYLQAFYNKWDFSAKQKNSQVQDILIFIGQNLWDQVLQAQSQQANIQEILDKKLLKIFKIMHVCDKQIIFQEYIRKKSKPSIKKQGFDDIKCQNESSFKTANLLLDMSVYLQTNCWSEFVSSCLQYVQYAEISIRNKLMFLQRCLAVMLLSRPHAKRVYFPFSYSKFFNLEFDPQDNNQAKMHEKVTLLSSPKHVKEWIQEMAKLSGWIKTQDEAIMSYIMIITAIINFTEQKFDSELYNLLVNFSDVKRWMPETNKTAFNKIVHLQDIQTFRQQFGKDKDKLFYFSNLDSSIVLIERVHTLTEFNENYQALDKAFYRESKILASRLNVAKSLLKVMKNKKSLKIKKRQKIQNINEIVAFSQISEQILWDANNKLTAQNIEQCVDKTWSKFRAELKLYHIAATFKEIIQEFLYYYEIPNVLDFHYCLLQLKQIQEILHEANTIFMNIITAENNSNESNQKKRLKELGNQIQEHSKKFYTWLSFTQSQIKQSQTTKKSKIIRARWEEKLKAISKKQQKTKKTGKKRQDALQDKASKIKGKI